jgi:hypothetical protein
MSRRFLDWDGTAHGLAHYWHQDGEGAWAQEAVQRTDDLLDLNREASNHCDPYNAARDVRMVARIPLIVIAKWRNEYGVDYWSRDPDMQRRVDRLLTDPEWAWLRTDLGHAHQVLLSPAPKVIV